MAETLLAKQIGRMVSPAATVTILRGKSRNAAPAIGPNLLEGRNGFFRGHKVSDKEAPLAAGVFTLWPSALPRSIGVKDENLALNSQEHLPTTEGL